MSGDLGCVRGREILGNRARNKTGNIVLWDNDNTTQLVCGVCKLEENTELSPNPPPRQTASKLGNALCFPNHFLGSKHLQCLVLMLGRSSWAFGDVELQELMQRTCADETDGRKCTHSFSSMEGLRWS